jgi:hypothetical protein
VGVSNYLRFMYYSFDNIRQKITEETKRSPKKPRDRGRNQDQEDERRLRKVIQAAFLNPMSVNSHNGRLTTSILVTM